MTTFNIKIGASNIQMYKQIKSITNLSDSDESRTALKAQIYLQHAINLFKETLDSINKNSGKADNTHIIKLIITKHCVDTARDIHDKLESNNSIFLNPLTKFIKEFSDVINAINHVAKRFDI